MPAKKIRKADVSRKTGETDIKISLNIDGTGKNQIKTGIGFFDHMLTAFSKHGMFDLKCSVTGDTDTLSFPWTRFWFFAVSIFVTDLTSVLSTIIKFP